MSLSRVYAINRDQMYSFSIKVDCSRQFLANQVVELIVELDK